MKFATERCEFEDLQFSDFDEAVNLFTDDKVREYLGGKISKEEAYLKLKDKVDNNKIWYLTVRLKETKEFVGIIIMTTTHNDDYTEELSYMFLPQYWGKGIAFETLSLFIDYLINLSNVRTLFAETQSANTRSCKLLERLGFVQENTVYKFGAEQKVYKHLLEEPYMEITSDKTPEPYMVYHANRDTIW